MHTQAQTKTLLYSQESSQAIPEPETKSKGTKKGGKKVKSEKRVKSGKKSKKESQVEEVEEDGKDVLLGLDLEDTKYPEQLSIFKILGEDENLSMVCTYVPYKHMYKHVNNKYTHP